MQYAAPASDESARPPHRDAPTSDKGREATAKQPMALQSSPASLQPFRRSESTPTRREIALRPPPPDAFALEVTHLVDLELEATGTSCGSSNVTDLRLERLVEASAAGCCWGRSSSVLLRLPLAAVLAVVEAEEVEPEVVVVLMDCSAFAEEVFVVLGGATLGADEVDLRELLRIGGGQEMLRPRRTWTSCPAEERGERRE